jgi:CRISPR-associated protein Csb2
MNRIEHGKPLKTVDKPKIFDRVLYTSVERLVGRPFRTFRIEGDDEARRFTYPQFKLIHIAGMVKHLAVELMKNNSPLPRELRGIAPADWVRAYVAGHQSQEDKNAGRPHTQLSYVPLQSIGMDHTDPGVRRVMVVAPLGDEAWLGYLAQRLDGMELRPLPNTTLPPGARLELIADNKKDGVRDAYCKPSLVWASVTPVILNRYVEKLKQTLPDGRVIDVLDRAEIQRHIVQVLQQSGIDQPCEFEWSAFSHFRKMLSAHKYRRDPDNPQKKFEIGYIRPDHLVGRTAVHLVIRFGRREDPNDEQSRWIPVEVPGPLTIGAGRHCGFGLMAAMNNEP